MVDWVLNIPGAAADIKSLITTDNTGNRDRSVGPQW